ncbi:MAG: tetratricopeptide repeat protein [Magnetococcales bacterium]|nr:tetratricopeptide repeat protein [Magnetococcales bacterium]MBF0148750.1 tetratricopeptide repeat protein [Magnetococcales bacterium]MBF0173773.1 tetratricopeptide repeat protein [Magnetococcales bacterium]MBF0348562.1 tetratricopeptide repeat protein [Magnetococcales bacterium]MBF0630301.1 tetratricopeptide repeat protein [Magnetococcales bacterium]
MNTQKHFQLGMDHLRKGHYEWAAKDFRNAIRSGGGSSMHWMALCAAHLQAHCCEDAINDCNQAEKLDPGNAKIPYYRAVAFMQQKMYQDAIDNLDIALERNPNYLPGILARATCHNALGHEEAADEDVKDAMKYESAQVQGFANEYGVLRTHFDAFQAQMDGDRPMPRMEMTQIQIDQLIASLH